ncbi:MAG: NHL repeat-containing protein [candidate division Zixibacteria bacterium]|nr:NHL repeat-containing protein [candidate division Zixibacteria bacterium]
MSKLSIIVSFAVVLTLACSPEKPGIRLTTQSILNLQIIDVIGPSIGSSRPLNQPRDIAINMFNEIFIADYGNDRIVKLDLAYNFIAEIGGFGIAEYSLNGPVSLALDNVSNLYVVDSGNRRLVRFDRRLNFISEESGYTKDNKIDFINPVSVNVAARGEILFGDEGIGACFKLDQFLYYIYEFGSRSSSQPIYYPADIDFDKNENIYVADSENGKILVYDDFGMHIRTIGGDILQKPTGVAVSPRIGIWVTDVESGMLYCFDYKGNEIFRWNGRGYLQLIKPTGLFIDDDTIYIVDSAASRIIIVKPIIGS